MRSNAALDYSSDVEVGISFSRCASIGTVGAIVAIVLSYEPDGGRQREVEACFRENECGTDWPQRIAAVLDFAEGDSGGPRFADLGRTQIRTELRRDEFRGDLVSVDVAYDRRNYGIEIGVDDAALLAEGLYALSLDGGDP